MKRSALGPVIVGALVVAASLAVVLVQGHDRRAVGERAGSAIAVGPTCSGGCGPPLPVPVLVSKVSIPKGTSAPAIVAYSTALGRDQIDTGALLDLREVRGEVTIRPIPAGHQLTRADFGLRGPIYYPRGYPKSAPATQLPAKITNSRWLGPPRSGGYLEVASGVWVDGSMSDAVLDADVANGTLVGYCRSMRAFQAHNPEIPFATKCWRR